MEAPQLQFLMLIFAGWADRHQQDVIEYLQEKNRAPRFERSAARRCRRQGTPVETVRVRHHQSG